MLRLTVTSDGFVEVTSGHLVHGGKILVEHDPRVTDDQDLVGNCGFWNRRPVVF